MTNPTGHNVLSGVNNFKVRFLYL